MSNSENEVHEALLPDVEEEGLPDVEETGEKLIGYSHNIATSGEHDGIVENKKKIGDDHEETNKKSLFESVHGGEQIKISFQNLCFTVSLKNDKESIKNGGQAMKQLEVLKNMTGFCLPGELTFIMGASGAGKTSLLNLMSDRVAIKPGMTVGGRITLNDTYDLSSNLFASYASYVMQDDVIFAYFTVKEALMFAGKLKLRVDESVIEQRVD